MKKIKGALFITMLIAVSAISCKKDKSGVDNGTAAATVTAGNYGFDGGSKGEFKASTAVLANLNGIFTMTAVKQSTSEQITIALYNINGIGKYSLDPNNNTNVGSAAIISKDFNKAGDAALNYSTGEDGPRGAIGGGEVNITKLTSTEVEGTFYIIAYNNSGQEAFVENGKFSGKLSATGK
ncbi:hypothetical protein D0C36_11850 [Mucilaginibacter conchicola]|uniref:Uncharacterized protein n=1 Tax=Mucilaginibacter conchicola TaxID=2303333 RepID=A0A372NS73_9SPHI|nr:DUF6252 family protein [Mucilaginibacter conchicola]RFZ92130.1 hypothetical protein D0C36_11850 [Mucilaginibacter conchicola]